jgi:WD40 repeat protein
MKLDEDHHRHLEHAASVEEGLIKVRSAQQNGELADLPPPAGTAEAPKRTPYPQAIRAEVEAARAGAYPPGRVEVDATSGQVGGRKSDPPVLAADGTQSDTPADAPRTVRSGSLVPPCSPTARTGSPSGTSTFELKVRQPGVKQLQVRGSQLSSARSAEHRRSTTAQIMGLSAGTRLYISRDTTREQVALQHEDEVMGLAFSPAGDKLVAGGEDSAVVLWDVSASAKLFEAKADAPIKAVAYSPSGCYVAAVDADSVVTVWRASDGEEMGCADVKGDVLSLAMSSSRREVLAVGTTEKTVTLFSVPDLENITELVHDGQARSLTFSPDGTMLAGGGGIDEMHGLMTHKGKDHKMKTVIWQVAADGAADSSSAKHLADVECDNIIHATAFAPTGKLLAVGGENCEVTVLLVDRGFERATNLQCAAGVRCLAWSPDVRFLAVGGEDMQISVWDIVDDVLALQLPRARDWYCSLAFSADGLWLASCGFGTREVTLHPVTTSEDRPGSRPPSRAPSEVDASDVSSLGDVDEPSDQVVRLSTRASHVEATTAVTMSVPLVEMGEQNQGFMLKVERVERVDDRRLQGRDKPKEQALMFGMPLEEVTLAPSKSRQAVELRHTDEVMGLSFSPDGRFVATGGEDANLVIWDAAGGSKAAGKTLDDPIAALAYSPSGLYVAVATTGSSVVLWSTAEGKEVGKMDFDCPVLSVAIGKSDLLAVGTVENGVSLLSLPDMQVIARLQHEGHVRCLSFSPDGGVLSGGGGIDDMHGLMTNKSQNHEMKTVVWRVAAVGEDCKYMGSITFPDIVHAVAFSPTGTVLAVGGENRMISMLLVDRDFENGSQLACAAGVRCLAWSPDSRFLASGGEDMQITIWDVLCEQIVFQTPKAKDWLCCVGFSPDGRWLASCGYGHNEAKLHPVEALEAEK